MEASEINIPNDIKSLIRAIVRVYPSKTICISTHNFNDCKAWEFKINGTMLVYKNNYSLFRQEIKRWIARVS